MWLLLFPQLLCNFFPRPLLSSGCLLSLEASVEPESGSRQGDFSSLIPGHLGSRGYTGFGNVAPTRFPFLCSLQVLEPRCLFPLLSLSRSQAVCKLAVYWRMAPSFRLPRFHFPNAGFTDAQPWPPSLCSAEVEPRALRMVGEHC